MLQANAAKCPEINTFDAAEKLGPWTDLQNTHFAYWRRRKRFAKRLKISA